MDIVNLRAFVRIAELNSVSAAARALKAPKSSVSRALSRLEASIGIALIERSTRHLRLTDAGILLLPHAIRILDDLDEAGAALDGLAGTASGLLRVNASYAFGQGLIAPMLPAFLARYPQVSVMLDLDYRRIDMLAEATDVVIRIGPLLDSGLVARTLPPIELWLCASPGYLSARGTPGSLSELASHDIVEREQTTIWPFSTGDALKQIEVRARLTIPDAGAQKVVLMGGAGIGRLPDYLAAPAVAAGDLIRLLPDLTGEKIEVHALYPSHRSLSAKVRVFIDALMEHITPHFA
ncbi:LysR family transcriptional regulator [Novosphingobium sp.]|uniref:LysR family transcriptional regulator n=1 Tax=Novosphingobium sp. TaxID=1874826 RepID=UPI002FDCEE10